MLLQINEAIITPNIETYPLYVTLAGTHVSSVKSNNTSKEPFDIRLINDRVYDNSILHARLIVIAPSGVDVRASGYSMDNDATVCQIKYELKSGMVLYTPIHVIADRAGTYPIDGKLEYWFSSDLSDQPTNNTVIMYASFNNTFRVISP
jgi:hypothetical protein